MINKVELAREAGISLNALLRVEEGLPCRMETKKKILLSLGFDLSKKNKVFPYD
jgi:hypothetical protein